MKNKNNKLIIILMTIIFLCLVVCVFIPKLLADFLLAHRFLAIGIGAVLLVTFSGWLVLSEKKLTVHNYAVEKGTLFENVVTRKEVVKEPVKEEPVETVVEQEEENTPGIVRSDYSFKSKLILSANEVKNYYKEIYAHATSFGVKVRKSWGKETIYLGRKVFAILTFKGKKLCVSFALNPKDYENSKYFFKDVSEVKKFEKTPLLMKITSSRKVKYTKELLNLIFANNGLEDKKLEVSVEEIPSNSREELVAQGLIKDPTTDKVNA